MAETRGHDVIGKTANRLYWNSDDTVSEIAKRLHITRGALYGAVRPVSAGARCPECGGMLYFSSRGARDAGRAGCAACGHTHLLADTGAAPRGRGRAAPSELADRTVVIGAGFLLGMLLGTAAGAIASRRRARA